MKSQIKINEDRLQAVRDRFDRFAVSLENEVLKRHENRRTWDKTCGQWLVYGLERQVGFGRAVEIESIIEQAFKNKASIKNALQVYFAGLTEAFLKARQL